ncbi:MAG TPA: Fur family transcriptional regulator [Bacillota bacterium]|nr:Fur family transcriptional regulator [Bacillota bacterium]
MPHKDAVDRVREILSQSDYRLTPQREAVLVVLLENSATHMTAEDIFAVTREHNPEIGLATIYRSLELFQNLGVVSSLHAGDGGRKYEIVPGRGEHYHHHLLCLDCGEITEFNEDLLEDLEKRIARENGFRIVDHSLRFFGYCRNCEKNHAQR